MTKTKTRNKTAILFDELIQEPIHMPGFPAIVVTRGFCYQFLKKSGWDESERGIGSLDYMTFATPNSSQPLTDADTRDHYLSIPGVKESYQRS